MLSLRDEEPIEDSRTLRLAPMTSPARRACRLCPAKSAGQMSASVCARRRLNSISNSHVFHQRFPEEKEILHNPVNPG